MVDYSVNRFDKYHLPKIELPKYELPKYELPKMATFEDRDDWNRKYGYHHTLGPAFGPKFMGGPLGI